MGTVETKHTPTVEERLAKWAQQPGAYVTDAERLFIEAMRTYRMRGVGFGWMQQVIEWEWQTTSPASLGPEYYEAELSRLREALEKIASLQQSEVADLADGSIVIRNRTHAIARAALDQGRKP